MSRVVRVFVLGSGSSGNCFVVEASEAGGDRLVIEAGMNPTRAVERMRGLGAELITPRPPLGIFVTHDHGDHSAHALPLARALRAPLYAHDAAPLERARRRLQVGSYEPGRPLRLGPFTVEALAVPHDAPHVALRIAGDGLCVGIATDLGHARRDLRAFFAECDAVFLEANYCPELLESGSYPPSLKRRVGGPIGHLSNDQAAELVRSLEDTRVRSVTLIHLSASNNTPERALGAVSSRLRRGSHLRVAPVVPHGGSSLLDLGELRCARGFARRGGPPEQLSFAFGGH